MRAEAFASARVVATSVASLNRPLVADKVRDQDRRGRVEADHVQHAAVVRVGEGEAVGGHAHNDRLRVTDELGAILTQLSKGFAGTTNYIFYIICRTRFRANSFFSIDNNERICRIVIILFGLQNSWAEKINPIILSLDDRTV